MVSADVGKRCRRPASKGAAHSTPHSTEGVIQVRKQIARALEEGRENPTTDRVLRAVFWQPRTPQRLAPVVRITAPRSPASSPLGRK